MRVLITAIVLMAMAPAALAYIGPGAGISLLGSILSILSAFVLAIAAVLFWPIRKMLKKRKARAEAETGDAVDVAVEGDGTNDG